MSGLLIGLANLVPGISGGTIAVVLGIYEELIKAIVATLKIKPTREQLRLLIYVGIGLVTAIFAGSKLIDISLKRASGITYAIFFGLILGTIPLLFRQLGKIKVLHLLIGIALFLFIEFSGISLDLSKAFISIAGFLAAFAMVMPGLSGSLVMLIFGVYEDVVKAVSEIEFSILIPFGVGVVFGMVVCAIFMKYLYERFPTQTKNMVFGLVLASLIKVQPFDKQSFTWHGYIVVVLLTITAAFVSYRLTKFSRNSTN